MQRNLLGAALVLFLLKQTMIIFIYPAVQALEGCRQIASFIVPMIRKPRSEVCVLAAPSGFANVVQLKEKLRDSDMAYIVARGKKGGTVVTAGILNAILRAIRPKETV